MKTEIKSFIFYDIETSGTIRHYDQIFQLSAVLTDENMTVLDQLELQCCRLPHVLPVPEAMGGAGAEVEERGGADCSHYDLVCAAQKTFTAWSPATFCAHNGNIFDDHILRQALFQTLHRPGLTQINGNTRIDSMAMAQACAILAPGRLTIPNLNGRPTFRLGPLARANGVAFPEESAHHAIHDVEAMRGLVAVMADRAPAVYAAVLRNSDPKSLLAMVQNHDILRLSAIHAGHMTSRIVAPAVTVPSDPSSVVVFDLDYHPDSIRRLSDEKLRQAFSASPRILRTIKLDSGPVLTAVGAFPGEPPLKLEANIIAERARIIREDQTLRARIACAIHSAQSEQQVDDHAVTPVDEALCEAFHATPWEGRRDILAQIGDQRLRNFGLRLIYAERPDLLTDAERTEMHAWQCDRILADIDAAWMPAPKALQTLTAMIRRAEPGMKRRLEQYIHRIARIRTVAVQFPHAAKNRAA